MPRLKKIDVEPVPKKHVELKEEYKLKPTNKPAKKRVLKTEEDKQEKENNRLEAIKIKINDELYEPEEQPEEQPEEDNKTEIIPEKINNQSSTEQEKELNKIYRDQKGEFVYKMTKGRHLKADGTYDVYDYKRKYYFKNKKPGPVPVVERRRLRKIIPKLTNAECLKIIKFIEDNILKNDKQETSSQNKE